jgi:hypothetical protein
MQNLSELLFFYTHLTSFITPTNCTTLMLLVIDVPSCVDLDPIRRKFEYSLLDIYVVTFHLGPWGLNTAF